MYSKCKQHITQNLQAFIDNRKESMGLAMIMVVFYHLKTTVFYAGFMGVDIFLFLSAYGLCHSYKKNSLSTFYKHRAKRIVPLFLLLGALANVVYLCFYHYELSIWDIFCNMTSLNYWKLGGYIFEWYLCFLIILYLLFPIINEISGLGGVELISIVLSTSLLFLTFGFDWNYDAAIGRIPVFFFGLLCYQATKKYIEVFYKCSLFYALALIVSVVLFLNHYVHLYVIMYMTVPVVIIFTGWLIRIIKERFKLSRLSGFIGVVGKYTLEIYVANTIVCIYRKSPDNIFLGQPVVMSIILYFIMNIVFAILFVKINKKIMSLLK